MKLTSLFLMTCLRPFAPSGVDAINTAGTFDGGLTRNAEVAITLPHLMLKFGTAAATQANLCGATDYPIGLAFDPALINAKVTIERLLDGDTKVGVASKAIAAGAPVYTAAGGKLTDTAVNNCYLVGHALTAAGADTDEFGFLPCTPQKQTV